MGRIELLVNLEPQPHDHQRDHGRAQNQGLLLHREEELPFERQEGARPVRRLKGQGSQEDIG
jgi:hypothetical protein